jgi:hypothetical protein
MCAGNVNIHLHTFFFAACRVYAREIEKKGLQCGLNHCFYFIDKKMNYYEKDCLNSYGFRFCGECVGAAQS